jgi:type II secretory pathway component PulK
MIRRARPNRGIALILSFLVLTVLTVVVMQLVYTARVEESLARNFRDGLENLTAARSGVVCAKAVLLESWDDFDSPEAAWTLEQSDIELGEARVSFTLADEEGKLNLGLITDQNAQRKGWARGVLIRLLTLARARSDNPDEPSPTKLFETLVEWAERGDTGRDFKPGGGGLGEEARDRRFLTLTELLFLEGFTRDLLFGEKRSASEEAEALEKRVAERAEDVDSDDFDLDTIRTEDEEEEEEGPVPLAEVLTVWGDGRINLNTAHVMLLQAMHPGMTGALAQALDDKRREAREPEAPPEGQPPPPPPPEGEEAPLEKPGFRTVDEIKEVEGIINSEVTPPLDIHKDLTPFLKVKSHVYRVRVVVENEKLTQRFEAILGAGDEGAPGAAAPTAGSGGETKGEGGGETKGEGTSGGGGEGGTPQDDKPEIRVLKMVQLD